MHLPSHTLLPCLRRIWPLLALPLLGACGAAPTVAERPDSLQLDPLRLANRITWGANSAVLRQIETLGSSAYLQQQLHPDPKLRLPEPVQQQIDLMRISQQPLLQLAQQLQQQHRAAQDLHDAAERKAALKAYQQDLDRLGREAASRSLLRALYSPNQLEAQMTWFWGNHFSVYQHKHQLRALLGDYEEQLRSHALGRFRDLLGVSAHHPAMLLYLDNQQNSAGHINENYARELLELHTLGVDGGYSQRDVQELARILTGVGVNAGGKPRANARAERDSYPQQQLFEFHPQRHERGSKQLLGQTIDANGLAELDQALDLLARHPATARFICRKLARYFTGNEPSGVLLAEMSKTFSASDGRIDATLQTLFHSREFAASLGQQFKDPLHYVLSAVRLAYDDKAILNTAPLGNWLNRMGEPLYGRQTPDGYPLDPAAWISPGQMSTRFEIARAIGSGSAGLFRSEQMPAMEKPAFPQLANGVYYNYWQRTLAPATLQALQQAQSPQEWNTLLLAAPEFMYR